MVRRLRSNPDQIDGDYLDVKKMLLLSRKNKSNSSIWYGDENEMKTVYKSVGPWKHDETIKLIELILTHGKDYVKIQKEIKDRNPMSIPRQVLKMKNEPRVAFRSIGSPEEIYQRYPDLLGILQNQHKHA